MDDVAEIQNIDRFSVIRMYRKYDQDRLLRDIVHIIYERCDISEPLEDDINKNYN